MTFKKAKMVTVQDIGLQLTKPVKELAQWNFPFSQVGSAIKFFHYDGNAIYMEITFLILSQTLEKYCSLFNTTSNKSFGEAGLVVQNSTAVYVHRIDSLWTKTEYCRNVLATHE